MPIMDIDLTQILFFGTLISGLLVLIDVLWLKPKRQNRVLGRQQTEEVPPELLKEQMREPVVIEYARSFFPVMAVVLVLRAFLAEPFQIPSGSMLPTLKIGDFILVNKYEYGLRLPILNMKIVDINTPQAGDVLVFKYPLNPKLNYIKRVIGVPGDQLKYHNKILYLNGRALEKKLITRNAEEMPGEWQFVESLGETQYQIFNRPEAAVNIPEFTIPEGYYFVMGDNRDHSNDSRYWCQGDLQAPACMAAKLEGTPLSVAIGLVPEENIVGKAVAVWMYWPEGDLLPSFSSTRLIH